MKKHLLLGGLIMFILNTAAFAGFGDSNKESALPAVNEPTENRLSDEEISRLSLRAETDNLSTNTLSNIESNDSNNNLRQPNQVIVEHRHHGYYYGGAGFLLVVILVILLV
jgi:hypothetical protein